MYNYPEIKKKQYYFNIITVLQLWALDLVEGYHRTKIMLLSKPYQAIPTLSHLTEPRESLNPKINL